MSKIGEVWFHRNKVAKELECHVLTGKNTRRDFFDDDGKDLRFKMPGLRWEAIKDKRKAVIFEYTKRIETIFEEVYAKITGDSRQSFGCTLLPTIKTPAISKTRSRFAKKANSTTNQKHEVTKSPVPFQLAEQSPAKQVPCVAMLSLKTPENVAGKRLTRARVRQSEISTRSEIQTSPNMPSIAPTEPECPTETELDVVILDVTNTSIRQSARSRSKKGKQLPKGDGAIQSSRRVTRASMRSHCGVENKDQNTEDEVRPTTARKRATRARTKNVANDPDSDMEPEPSLTRTTRSTRSRQTTSKPVKPAPVIITEEKSSEEEDASKTVKKASQVRKISIDVQRITTHSSPTLESQPTTSSLRDDDPRVDVVEQSATEQNEHMETIEEVQLSKRLTHTQASHPLRSSSRARSSTTICILDSDSDGEISYTRPPPPKRLLLKLKKKKQPARRVAKKQADSINQNDSAHKIEDKGDVEAVKGDRIELTNSAEPSKAEDDVEAIGNTDSKNICEDDMELTNCIQTVDSHETLYESCVSDVDPTSPAGHAALQNGTFVITPKQSKLRSPTEHTPVSNPASMPGYLFPNPQGTYIKHKPGYLSPNPYVKQKPQALSPTSVPYLTGTPKTIQRLQEEHRVRTKGTLLSLSQLRSRTTPQSGNRRANRTGTPGSSKIPRPTTPSLDLLSPTSSELIRGQNSPGSSKRLRSNSPGSSKRLRRSSSLETQQPASKKVSLAQRESFSNGSTEEEDGVGEQADTEGTCTSPDERYGTETEGSQTGLESEEKSSSDSSDTNSSCEKIMAKTKPSAFVWKMFSRRAGDDDQQPATRPVPLGAPPVLTSFLPAKNSPKKHNTRQHRQEKLAEMILRKRAEEERRKEELAAKKQQDLQEKIRRREERAKKVVEKQAALMKQEADKKKKKVEELTAPGRDAQVKQLHQKKAREMEQKNRQRMQAAEGRRKQEEEQQKKRLKQLEEERTMNSQLALKRKELEEDEKKRRRQEKQMLERERQLQRDAEKEKERELELKKRQEEEDERRTVAEAQRKYLEEKKRLEQIRKEEERKKFANLLDGMTNTQSNTSRFMQQWKQLKADAGEFLGNVGKNRQPKNPSHNSESDDQNQTPDISPPSGALLNSTFTKENISPPSANNEARPVMKTSPAGVQVMVTPQNAGPQPKTSYEMTPVEQDPLFSYENYDIEDLSSDDQTDDEDQPRKQIPVWASKDPLYSYMRQQEAEMLADSINVHNVFPPSQLLKNPDLARIFKHKRKRFFVRSSSAHWDSPLMKKSRVD